MNGKNLIIGLSLAAVVSVGVEAQSVYPGVSNEKFVVGTAAPVEAESFDLRQVRLLPSRFRENLERDSVWMASLEVNRLLHSFRNTAGVFSSREGGYMTVKKLGGWESLDCDLRGHTTGHLLSAYGLMYAATGCELFKLKGDSLVSGLAEVQQALGSGYLSAFPEGLIDRNLQGKSVWAPWYTLHKLFAGLMDQYLYADNAQALEVVKRMGDWAYNKLHGQSEETRRKMIRNEFGGINEAFYNLYALTGDDRYRWLAEYFYHNDVIDPLKEERDDLGTKHTNTFIPSVLRWEEKGITLRQTTDFPAEETTRIELTCDDPVRATLRLRYPSWSGKPVVKVNGRRVSVRRSNDGYMAFERTWKSGDCIEATFPMSLHLEATPDDPQRAALLYGPVVLAGRLGTEGMEAPAPHSNPQLYNDYYTYDYRIPEGLPTQLKWDAKHPAKCLKPLGGLRFQTADGVEVAPLYDVHRERYVVYWEVIRE